MAEGGGGDAPIQRVPRGVQPESADTDEARNPQLQRQISQQEIGDQATVLLRNFIIERFQRDAVPNAPRQEELGPANPEQEVWLRLGTTLRDIGDILDQDTELQRMINTVPMNSPLEAIIAVASVIFGDGEIHWGRIIGLFYFAYRMCVRAMDNVMREKFPGWINQLIREIVKFLVLRFADWIIRRGGWTSIKEYFVGASTMAWAILLAASLATCLFAIYKLNK